VIRWTLLIIAVHLAAARPGAAQAAPASATDTLRLTLEEAVERVTTRSTAVRMAAARHDDAEAAVSVARAARLPTVTGNAQLTWQPSVDESASGFRWSPDPTGSLEQRVRYLEHATPAAGLAALPPQLIALAARHSWTAGISGQFTLLDGGRTRAAVSGASARRTAARAAVDAERSRAQLDAELAYRRLLLARERVAVAKEGRATMAADHEATRRRWSRGVASELDTLRAEMQLADLDRRLADAVAAEHGADVQLRVLTDLPVGPALELTTPVAVAVPDRLAQLDPSALLDAVEAANRRSAEAAVAAAAADLRAARARRRPSLVVRADLQAIQAPDDPFDLSGRWTDVQTVSAAIQVPLLRPITRAEVRSAEARVAQATVDARRVADGATSERAGVRAERERARHAWQAARARLAAAQRAATLTDSAAARGIGTTIDQARAQLDVLEAGTQVLEALIDYLSADAAVGASSRGSAGQP
jgi:cobalt-zinc-cadmium efflux system outer membrane protein